MRGIHYWPKPARFSPRGRLGVAALHVRVQELDVQEGLAAFWARLGIRRSLSTDGTGRRAPDAADATNGESSDDEDSSEDADNDGNSARKVENEYSAQDYAHLDVSAEVKELFQYISQYTARDAELESTLKPPAPDGIAAVQRELLASGSALAVAASIF